jgi:hypothetical protein
VNGRSIALDSGWGRGLEIWWRLYLNYSDFYHRLLVARIRALLVICKVLCLAIVRGILGLFAFAHEARATESLGRDRFRKGAAIPHNRRRSRGEKTILLRKQGVGGCYSDREKPKITCTVEELPKLEVS